MTDDLKARARIKSAMLLMGERIEFGSDAAIIDELVAEIERLEARIAELEAPPTDEQVEAAAEAIHETWRKSKFDPHNYDNWGQLVAQGHQGMHRANDRRAEARAALTAGKAKI